MRQQQVPGRELLPGDEQPANASHPQSRNCCGYLKEILQSGRFLRLKMIATPSDGIFYDSLRVNAGIPKSGSAMLAPYILVKSAGSRQSSECTLPSSLADELENIRQVILSPRLQVKY